ncbi:uncharacterized protein LOC124919462 [Impatiens glandulifera]|uniref:uncharacterized protein LOC124919462 n=1 Tax=Impatiens glandulifera TaxID=253017 RepID=UPI001FB11903|nr:uncharacterized protein LOC124919462 [Impatiens glandulifera]
MKQKNWFPTNPSGATKLEEDNSSENSEDFSNRLPLPYIRKQTIPPAPSQSQSAIDWLPDFADYSWIAYGASSLLVISHLPTPLSKQETLIGPILSQVFELSNDGSGAVTAVSWCLSTPSNGDLAAALGNCIGLFSNLEGSFCWRQTTVLVQSTKVEAIKWTGSGDGIISCGVDVVFWRKKSISWEIAWKFKPKVPHTLVSATTFLEGPSATAPFSDVHIEVSSSAIIEASKSVLVYHGDFVTSKYVKYELRHPQPVSMIQWRPSGGRLSELDGKHLPRHVLLTCCLDGTARVWSEIGEGRIKRMNNKDINDKKNPRRSFHVVAVIEINQALNASLGFNVFVRWATEVNNIPNAGSGADQHVSSVGYPNDTIGRCEWLVAFGPHKLVSFWAIHCLDDHSPMRFPRVTLWKRQELTDTEMAIGGSLVDTVVVSRNQAFGPPAFFHFVGLLPSNFILRSHFNIQISSKIEDESSSISGEENIMSTVLNLKGHSGKILHVLVHPCKSETQIAVSLDSNGLVLFWSISANSNCFTGLPTLKPAWKPCGWMVVQDPYPKYTSLTWAPSLSVEYHILLMGHTGGVDCILVKISRTDDDETSFHKLCTLPLTCLSLENGPHELYSIPLPSTCKETFIFNSYILLAICKKPFQALSWKITMHSYDSDQTFCQCKFEAVNKDCTMLFESNFAGKTYCIAINSCSSVLPDSHENDEVTSFSVVCPNISILSEKQNLYMGNELCGPYPVYHMATGSSNGSIKLWRSVLEDESRSRLHWELMGMLDAHEGQISVISATDCGRKIATVSSVDHLATVHIWELVYIAHSGKFILEDTLSLEGEIISINWLTVGNGQLLLGVSLPHEIKVYSPRYHVARSLVRKGKPIVGDIWFCISSTETYAVIHDFLWSPNATIVIVHDEYFSVLNDGLLFETKKNQDTDLWVNAKVCMDDKIPDIKGSPHLPVQMNVKSGLLSTISFGLTNGSDDSVVKTGIRFQEVIDKLGAPLPVYHPNALLVNMYSGHWKRACVALQHLIQNCGSYNSYTNGNNCAKSRPVIPSVHLSTYLEGGAQSTSLTFMPFQSNENASAVKPPVQIPGGLSHSWGIDTKLTSSLPSTKFDLSSCAETIEKQNFADLTFSEKIQTLSIVDLLREVSNPHAPSVYDSLDEPGRRFWVCVRFQLLYIARKYGRVASAGELVADSELFGWAFHSDCQENLFTSLLSSDPSWEDMRKNGVGYWYTNTTQLRQKMEKLARQQYLKNKDPKACALLYIALNRIQVLTGLFKISKDEKDKPLVAFLSRNFQEEKNRAAALKNAYVLMGRHQLELAVAFFLLGGDTSSAINVCAKNLGDEQLALVICRLIEGGGGSLEQQLVSKWLLPSAVEREDYWLASLLEWMLGNYLKAFLRMLGVEDNRPAIVSKHASFLDPSIGAFCLMLSNKNMMRNAIGERNAAVLGRWAILMSSVAFERCRLPLEALDTCSCSLTLPEDSNQASMPDIGHSELLDKLLKKSTSNWISSDVAFQTQKCAQKDLAMQYISRLLKEHPSWLFTSMVTFGPCKNYEHDFQQYDKLLRSFQNKLSVGIRHFEQKFSISFHHLLGMIILLLSNSSTYFGCRILDDLASWYSLEGKMDLYDSSWYPICSNLLLESTKEVSYLFSKYIFACGMACSKLKQLSTKSNGCGESIFTAGQFYMEDLILSLHNLRATIRFISDSSVEDVSTVFLDLAEYFTYFASAWFLRDFKFLLMIVKPLASASTKRDIVNYGMTIEDVRELLKQLRELLNYSAWTDDFRVSNECTNSTRLDKDENDVIWPSIPEDLKCKLTEASLWWHMSNFVKIQTNLLSEKLEDCYSFGDFCRLSTLSNNNITLQEQMRVVSVALAKLLETTCVHISSYFEEQLMAFLQKKIRGGYVFSNLTRSQHKELSQGDVSKNVLDIEDRSSLYDALWESFADPELILGEEKSRWLHNCKPKVFNSWSDLLTTTTVELNAEEQEGRSSTSSSSSRTEFPIKNLSSDGHSSGSNGKDISLAKEVNLFQKPKEICKRNGELLEALCVNSIVENQAVLASNRKGLIFFNLDGPLLESPASYIWTKTDWPHNGWAGSESSPVPTCVSPGIGLGINNGAHLGLGGATIGTGSLSMPGKDLTGGGAFGIPGYAGIGASGLGWGLQEDFEEIVDPPTTMESIHTRALSSHPSMPYFLVGSNNTLVYLWEFGKHKATATYGVLPAANVPPPYALASVSAVQFDQCGHRFATAALDGTVCTWQLEVGGRSNIYPTESSLCFNNHASDVTYLAASGSIVAAAGYSSSGVNVVIWDTLTPPGSSRASIMCHEGGARSLSVFDNDIGSGSVSPYIVTGGKYGDIGLHDFRYIATGKVKKQRHVSNGQEYNNTSLAPEMQSRTADQNRNGMLWYIPKAHSGSITKISTIPNTSFFLTGSKDGDVKLWDARTARLVFQWPKMHDRHTFLQPGYRGFSGVVRDAVTDIRVLSDGFLTCGGDGSVKMVQFNNGAI